MEYRDNMICAAYMRGDSMKEISSCHGLTTRQILRIVRAEGITKKPTKADKLKHRLEEVRELFDEIEELI